VSKLGNLLSGFEFLRRIAVPMPYPRCTVNVVDEMIACVRTFQPNMYVSTKKRKTGNTVKALLSLVSGIVERRIDEGFRGVPDYCV
jgi:hypothetical protein